MNPVPRERPKRARRAGALLAVTLLAGCASTLFPKLADPPTRYSLNDDAITNGGEPVRPALQSLRPTLVVDETRAAPRFDTTAIVYLREANRFETFALNQWVDTPARMLGPLIVRAIEREGAFGAVVGAPTAAEGTYRLSTEMTRLQQDFTQSPSRVQLTLRAVLIENAKRRVIATQTFEATVTARSDDPAGGVIAANQAVARVLPELAAFCKTAFAPAR